jgi:uncharacterized protein (TIGR02145 family)
MKTNRIPYLIKLIIGVSFLINFSIEAQTIFNAPGVTKTSPEFGDWQVDPNLKEIVIQFDQEMQSGYSIVDSKYQIKYTGKPTWKNSKTIVLPVKLESDCFYEIPLNSNKYRNFVSKDGAPLNPTVLYFHTKKADLKSTKEYYSKAFENFRNYFTLHYSYKDLLGINWEKEFEKSKDEIINSQSDAEFSFKLLKVLRKSNDTHLWLELDGIKYNAFNGKIIPANSNINSLLDNLKNVSISNRSVVACGKSDKFGYISIRSLANGLEDDLNFAIKNLNSMRDLPNIIIDLRLNNGGNDGLGRLFVSNLITDSITYEKVVVWNDITNKFDKPIYNSIKPNINSIKYKGNIYVLIGGQVTSSAESFVLMLKQIPGTKLVGSTTYGSSGNPHEFQILTNLKAYIPSWQAYDIKGNLIEGKGIAPDYNMEYPESAYKTDDPLFTNFVRKMIDSTYNKAKEIKPIKFSKLNEEGEVRDFEGNIYKTLVIGNQRWMAENIKSKFYSDGTPILGFHAYNDDTANLNVYGGFYNWNTVMNGTTIIKSQGVCPTGWHVPSFDEWVEMINFMGGYQVAGGKMKETGTEHWNEPNESATNEFGFTAIPSGRYPKSYMRELQLGNSATWWSSTKSGIDKAKSFTILHKSNESLNVTPGVISEYDDLQNDAYSVRCIKDSK